MFAFVRLLSIAAGLFFCANAYAYHISPVIMTFSPAGAASKKNVDIQNDTDEPVAVELSVAGRSIDKDGKEGIVEDEALEAHFSIYPSQLVIRPKSTRTVQMRYVGPKKLTKEQAYRLIAEEVSIDFERPKAKTTQGGVDLLIAYHTSVYVAPKGAASNIKVVAKKQDNSLVLEVNNTGNAHEILEKPRLKKGETILLDEKTLKPVVGQNILAGNSRNFTMPWPKSLKAEDLNNVSLSY